MNDHDKKLVSDVSNEIQTMSPDLAKNAGGDEYVADYVYRALIYVIPLDAPDQIKALLVRLWALHLMTADQTTNLTSKHLGELAETYADTSQQDDDPLAEFKALLSQYGLGSADIYGF